MPPVGAPAMSFSARTHASASRARPGSSPSNPSSNRSLAAAPTEHSSAAELDSPAPTGTRLSTVTSMPRTSCPASRSAHSTPAT